MEIKELLKQSKEIWGEDKPMLPQIVARMGTVFGDICRWLRNSPKDAPIHTDDELKKELGNMIFSSIRWADDLGYDPEECVKLAIDSQKKFQK